MSDYATTDEIERLRAVLDEAAAEIADLKDNERELVEQIENMHSKIVEQRIELGELRYALSGQIR